MKQQSIETEEERVELSKGSCESFTGFEVPCAIDNQQFTDDLGDVLGPIWTETGTKCATNTWSASTALQAASETLSKPALKSLSDSHSGRFRRWFWWVFGLYIPILLSAVLPLSGCTQIPCEIMQVLFCTWTFPEQKSVRVLPPPRLANPVKIKNHPVRQVRPH